MSRYLQFKNHRTNEVEKAIDVTKRSEREIEKIERGMLMRCDDDRGWYVDDYEAEAPHS